MLLEEEPDGGGEKKDYCNCGGCRGHRWNLYCTITQYYRNAYEYTQPYGSDKGGSISSFTLCLVGAMSHSVIYANIEEEIPHSKWIHCTVEMHTVGG